MDCLFCKIASKEIDAKHVYEDEHVVAFEDASPQAPHHILVIPRKHIATLNDFSQQEQMLIGHLVLTAQHIAKERNLHTEGYRILMNCNQHGGQTVFHVHLHLLGGRQMHWPPG